jgi:SNF2 family DNA or RNA helicase
MLTPRPYQIAGRDFLAANSRALLADEMRVGKTPQAILASQAVGAVETLVLCPAIAVPQWRREWARWAPGAPAPTVVSYDTARAHTDRYRRAWDAVIVDEAHFIKNPGALRTQMIYGPDGLARNTGHFWALTGTPAPSHVGELWPLLRAFGRTRLTYSEFLRTYCYVIPQPYPRKPRIAGTRIERIAEVREMLRPIILRRTRAEVAPEMPAIQYNPLYVNSHTRLPDAFEDEAEVEAFMAHSPPEDRQQLALAKVPALADEIEHAIGGGLYRQTVVFGHHTAPIIELGVELKLRGIKAETLTGATSAYNRDRLTGAFSLGIIEVMVANIQAAGTAIDLSAASHGYFLEMDWVPGNNVQAANRLVSMQNPRPVTMDVVTVPGSRDESVQRVCARRTRETQQLY